MSTLIERSKGVRTWSAGVVAILCLWSALMWGPGAAPDAAKLAIELVRSIVAVAGIVAGGLVLQHGAAAVGRGKKEQS